LRDLDRLGEDHAEIGRLPLGIGGQRVLPAPALAGEDGLQILPPGLRHDDIADLERGVDAAGDPGKDEPLDSEMVERLLGGHRRVHHADAAQEQHHRLARYRAGEKHRAAHDMLLAAFEVLLQELPFRLVGGHHDGARGGIERGRPKRHHRPQQPERKTNEQHPPERARFCPFLTVQLSDPYLRDHKTPHNRESAA
jgi:hypothetical protein